MMKFYTTVGTLVRTKDGITISQKGKDYPLTKQEKVLWLILANDIIEDINVKQEYESKIKQQNEYEEDTFERTLDSLVQKGAKANLSERLCLKSEKNLKRIYYLLLHLKIQNKGVI